MIVRKLILFGNGRGADVAYRFMSRDTQHEIVGFTVDQAYIQDRTFHGLPLVPFETVETVYPPEEYRMLILLGYQGMNELRQRKFLEAKAKGYAMASYVASDIFRVEDIDVGENCFILDNQSISLDVKIGNNVVMWSSNHIGDMTHIADHAWISSHVTIAANVSVGERAFMGIGATVSNHVAIAADTFVGANKLITANTEAGGVYVQGQDVKLGANSRSFMRVMMAGKKL
jgi:sugar O-acyltransferase (sialic acid O-acetyltransferase NeuD family)